MSKYKPGDRVVIIGKWHYGVSATVLPTHSQWAQLNREINIDCDKELPLTGGTNTLCDDTDIILASIFHSPLYQALK